MTNFDPGGLLVLVTAVAAVVAGLVSIGLAQLASKLGYGTYETDVAVVVGALIAGWVAASLLVATSMLQLLAVTLAMAGAFAATRSVTASSYGWVLGVALLFAAFVALSAAGVYDGVDRTGRPQGFLSRHLLASHSVGLFAFGAIGGKVAQAVQRRWPHSPDADERQP